jgi:hypothetical protein
VVLAGNSGVAEDGAVVKRAAAGAAGGRGGCPAPRKQGREADNDDLASLLCWSWVGGGRVER